MIDPVVVIVPPMASELPMTSSPPPTVTSPAIDPVIRSVPSLTVVMPV
jgi:hypothetical protein